MKFRCLPFVAAVAAMALPIVALAQASAPVAASAPRAAKPSPKLMTAEEKRDTALHDLEPERQVTPQVNIPLNKPGQEAAKPYGYTKSRTAGTSTGGIDDAAARCKAEANEQARAACRDRVAKESKTR